MKRPKKHHLGESLQDIIKKQEDTDVRLPEYISDKEQSKKNESVDLFSDDEFYDLKDEDNALTIVEDLHDATMYVLDHKHKSEKDAIDKQGIIISEIDFEKFTFFEFEGEYQIVIKKDKNKNDKETLEQAFLEIITEISDVNQFL